MAITLSQNDSITGAVVVTTPQVVATDDVYESVSRCEKVGIPILGVVEKMSWFIDTAGVRIELFGKGGGQACLFPAVGYAERSFRRDWDEHHASLRFRRAESYADDTRIDVRSIFTVESSAPAHHVRLVLTYDRGRFGAGEELQTFEEMAVVDELVPLEP